MNDSGVIYQDNGLNLSAGTLSRPKPNLLRDHCQTFMQPTRLKHVESKRGIHGHKFRKKREKIKIWGKERVARWVYARSKNAPSRWCFPWNFSSLSFLHRPFPPLFLPCSSAFFFFERAIKPENIQQHYWKIYSYLRDKRI